MWEYTFKVVDEKKLSWGLKNGDTLTFTKGCRENNITWLDLNGTNKHKSAGWKDSSIPNSYGEAFRLVSKKVWIEKRCEAYMYNTKQNLLPYEIGDIIEVTFDPKHKFRVRKEYIGKKIKFQVMNTFNHEWGQEMKRLALVPIDKVKKFKEKDILFLDNTWRFEALMIDLFPINRRPYAGWKNKTVKIKPCETFDELLEL